MTSVPTLFNYDEALRTTQSRSIGVIASFQLLVVSILPKSKYIIATRQMSHTLFYIDPYRIFDDVEEREGEEREQSSCSQNNYLII